MNTIVFAAAARPESAARSTSTRGLPFALRTLLLAVCLASAAIALRIGDPATALQADPELARLLRGMALLKGLMVVAAIALLLWRFGHPIAPRVATGYLASTGLMAAAAAMIWQLTALLPAAAAFHAGLFVALIVAWRADGDLPVRARTLG